MSVKSGAVHRAAHETLGHERLLPGQEEAVRAVLDGRDTLALLPTGGGKSAIYQLAGVERPGPTIVVSPLIALQQDQLEALRSTDLAGAAVSSAVPERERREAIDRFAAGDLEFLLLAPEQLADPETLERLAAGRPSLFVVDEAHCVSEWGHDFRPEYRRLGAIAEALGRPPILGLTATASPGVREEIVEWLRLRDPVVVARGFDRPNLVLTVARFADAGAKRDALVEWVRTAARPGIVYTATRQGATDTAAALRAAGIAADPYHAGLGTRRRAEVQAAFFEDRLDVVVATIAFGMGVDKPDVRFVAHLDVSDGLDAYHQEIGRAGRDGEPAEARLFYRPDDLGLRRFQGAPPALAPDDVRAVLRVLGRRPPAEGIDGVPALAAAARRSDRRTEAAVARLEELGAVIVDPDGRIRAVPDGGEAGELATRAAQAQERRRQFARSRVEVIRGYAETDGCRRRFLLNYFGEEYEPPCGACDNCLAALSAGNGSPEGRPSPGGFALNDRVRHVVFGAGLVSRIEDDRVTVLFDDVGYRTLGLAEVAERGLLARET